MFSSLLNILRLVPLALAAIASSQLAGWDNHLSYNFFVYARVNRTAATPTAHAGHTMIALHYVHGYMYIDFRYHVYYIALSAVKILVE